MTDREILRIAEAWEERQGWGLNSRSPYMWKSLNKLCRQRPGWFFKHEDNELPCWMRGRILVTVGHCETGPIYEVWLGDNDDDIQLFTMSGCSNVEFFLNAVEPAVAGSTIYFDRASTERALYLADELLIRVEGLLLPEDYANWQTVRALAGPC